MGETREVRIPDIGGFDGVDVIEVLVAVGDRVERDQSLITLESDKASMEVPAPVAGVIKAVKVAVGDQVSEGDPIVDLEVSDAPSAKTPEAPGEGAPEPLRSEARAGSSEEAVAPAATPWAEGAARAPERARKPGAKDYRPPPKVPGAEVDEGIAKVHAGPAVRRLAREFGVDLRRVEGTGRKDRILAEDVQEYVKRALESPAVASSGAVLPEMPVIDFGRFGPIEREPLTRINKATARNVHRSWLHVPHVTQFDEADITDLDDFRRSLKPEAEKRGVKLTFLSFLLKATAAGLRAFPRFRSSLSPDGEELIIKQYVHIGVAVDTPQGLVVPVIRDVDQKGLFALAEELEDVSQRARDGHLTPADLTGGVFSISSLGGIGGTAFTPIVNAPEVAILGVARADTKPVWREGAFVPRLLLPLALSYDHRVIDGAAGVRFTSHLARLLSDLRRLLI